jgi:hypothetical protein
MMFEVVIGTFMTCKMPLTEARGTDETDSDIVGLSA